MSGVALIKALKTEALKWYLIIRLVQPMSYQTPGIFLYWSGHLPITDITDMSNIWNIKIFSIIIEFYKVFEKLLLATFVFNIKYLYIIFTHITNKHSQHTNTSG